MKRDALLLAMRGAIRLGCECHTRAETVLHATLREAALERDAPGEEAEAYA